MVNQGPNPYLKTKVLTASPEQLRLMLYEGAIKFCRQAREAIPAADFEASFNALNRAQKIVLELSTSLDHGKAPELCSKLNALYTYIYRRLVDANMHRDIAPINEAMQLLEYEKETWQMLMKQLADDGPSAAASKPQVKSVAGAQQTAISSLSING